MIVKLLFKAPDRNPENIKIQGHLPHQMDISWEVKERAHLSIRLHTRNHYSTNAFFKVSSVHYSVAATVAYWTQWPWSGVQGELQETGGGRCLDWASGQKTLLCCEEHVHFCPLRDQNSEQEQPWQGPRSQSCHWVLRRRWWVLDFICSLLYVFISLMYLTQSSMFLFAHLFSSAVLLKLMFSPEAKVAHVAVVFFLVTYCELFVSPTPTLSSVVFWHCLRENVSG